MSTYSAAECHQVLVISRHLTAGNAHTCIHHQHTTTLDGHHLLCCKPNTNITQELQPMYGEIGKYLHPCSKIKSSSLI